MFIIVRPIRRYPSEERFIGRNNNDHGCPAFAALAANSSAYSRERNCDCTAARTFEPPGQHCEYLLKQLRGFKSGSRTDIDGTMTTLRSR
jgi:hypothetical protein